MTVSHFHHNGDGILDFFFKAPWAAVYEMTNIDLLDSLMQIRSAASSLPRDLFVGTELLYEEWVFRYPVSFMSQA